MSFKSIYWRLLNTLARVFGLMSTASGAYFAARGIYYLIEPEVAYPKDILGFHPSFRLFAIATVLLVIGVHFIRGEAHRPDLPENRKPGRSLSRRTHNWWNGEPLNDQPDREADP